MNLKYYLSFIRNIGGIDDEYAKSLLIDVKNEVCRLTDYFKKDISFNVEYKDGDFFINYNNEFNVEYTEINEYLKIDIENIVNKLLKNNDDKKVMPSYKYCDVDGISNVCLTYDDENVNYSINDVSFFIRNISVYFDDEFTLFSLDDFELYDNYILFRKELLKNKKTINVFYSYVPYFDDISNKDEQQISNLFSLLLRKKSLMMNVNQVNAEILLRIEDLIEKEIKKIIRFNNYGLINFSRNVDYKNFK